MGAGGRNGPATAKRGAIGTAVAARARQRNAAVDASRITAAWTGILASVGHLAVENVAVAYVRGRVPEFEPTFEVLLDEEGYWELGSVQVFAELARRTVEAFDDEAARRTFAAVEFVQTAQSVREGTDEAAEFFEALAAEAAHRPERFRTLRALWGEPTQRWFEQHCPELMD